MSRLWGTSFSAVVCGVEGYNNWYGITIVRKKLFCAPYKASVVLVINADTEEMHTIDCVVEGEDKWIGIAAVGNNIFCAPYVASMVLVIDADTE